MSRAFEIIAMKANGMELDRGSISQFMDLVSDGAISDAQVASMLMAIYINGMSVRETQEYTKALIGSGETIDHDCNGFVVDKHSTGGVGDKVSFIVGPVLASLGYFVPMIAGRSLGFTGGTIDKLESIPGYDVNLTTKQFKDTVKSVGISIMAQTDMICPLDRKIYSLRDITATIASNPLITGSIMSKKIAEGINGLIIDMKIGSGTFINDKPTAKKLLRLMGNISDEHELKFSYIMSSMDTPLGRTSGLHTEIHESIEALQGTGESRLMDVVYSIATKAQALAGDDVSIKNIDHAISSGSAYEIFERMVHAHGGRLEKGMHIPTSELVVKAEESGFIHRINARSIGTANTMLGCGRINHRSELDHSAGIEILMPEGENVKEGDPILRAFCSDKNKINEVKNILEKSIIISSIVQESSNIIIE